MKLIPYEINENLRGAKNKFPYGIKQMNARECGMKVILVKIL